MIKALLVIIGDSGKTLGKLIVSFSRDEVVVASNNFSLTANDDVIGL